MSGATDSGMIKMMSVVMGALAVFAIIIGFAARILGDGADNSDDPMMRNALIERIEPVGAVRTSVDDLPAAATAEVAVASGPKSVQDLVNGACASCHLAGVADAPKLDDDAAWAERRELGLDALVSSVINGKGAMPARGGSTYNDDEILLAVQHMAGFEVEDSAEANTGEAAEQQTASADAAPAAEVAAAAAVVGVVPEGLTDNIKNNVDGVCIGCHISGVGNAPKVGDAAAWQERADKGMDALTSSVINGLNVMPARGGSVLSDEEIPIAIQYLMSK